MSVELLGGIAGRAALLGDGAFYRLVVEKSGGVLGATDEQFYGQMRQLHAEIAASGLAFGLSAPAVAPGDRAAVLDVKVTRAGASKTIADLLRAVEKILDIPGRNLGDLRSVERVAASVVLGRTVVKDGKAVGIDNDRAAKSAGAVADEFAREHPPTPNPLLSLWGRVQSLGGVVYWAVVLLVLGVVAVVLYQLNRKASAV